MNIVGFPYLKHNVLTFVEQQGVWLANQSWTILIPRLLAGRLAVAAKHVVAQEVSAGGGGAATTNSTG